MFILPYGMESIERNQGRGAYRNFNNAAYTRRELYEREKPFEKKQVYLRKISEN